MKPPVKGDEESPDAVLVTTTSADPADLAGVRQVISKGETTTTLVAEPPPMVTDTPPSSKFSPSMVTEVPPDVGPVSGEMLASTGAVGTEELADVSFEWGV